MDLTKLVKKYGTPLYVFDTDAINERISYMREYFCNKKICFAIKANTFVIKEIIKNVDCLEVCSNGEYEICKKLKVDGEKIVLSGVYKNPLDFENIFQNKEVVGKFTVESLTQYEMLKMLATKYERKINILIRLTSGNQFGINEDEVKTIISQKCDFINIKGIEYFSGTQKHNLKIIAKEMNHLKELVLEIEEAYDISISEIEYGLGLPVYYFEGETFDEETYFKELNNLLEENFANKVITLEIGRSLVAHAGYYLTKVVDKKTNKNGNFVILDGGINHLVYYGQSMAMKIPKFDIIPSKTGDVETYNLCGALCTINDLIVKQLSVPILDLNDIFVFKNVGAYSVTEGISLFLSRDLPKVLLIKNNKEILVRETINTYKINEPNYEGE